MFREPRALPPSEYRNKKPSTDVFEILGWLERGAGNSRLWIRDGVAWVVIHYFGREMGHHVGTDEYQVDLATAQVLIRDSYVSPTPHWGYTEESELQINDLGRSYYYHEEMKTKRVAKEKATAKT
ncbi:MAG: hypothetical protein AAB455_03330 [Patescibacteria group bacterium]